MAGNEATSKVCVGEGVDMIGDFQKPIRPFLKN
jgi:hypothetical protein